MKGYVSRNLDLVALAIAGALALVAAREAVTNAGLEIGDDNRERVGVAIGSGIGGLSTLQAGIGLVQSRARGSMAALQSGLYRDMANLYANQEYEAADFNYYIQREHDLIQQEIMRKQEEQRKKTARIGSIVGAIGLIAAPFTGGATLGLAAQGLGQVGNTGWI